MFPGAQQVCARAPPSITVTVAERFLDTNSSYTRRFDQISTVGEVLKTFKHREGKKAALAIHETYS
jgi:hypothetical protein